MYQFGHYGAALLAYAPLAGLLAAADAAELAVLGAGIVVVLSTLPDVDHRLSLVEHRGLTHTVWFVVLVGLAVAVLGGAVGAAAGPLAALGLATFGLLLGCLSVGSHVAADALTPMGVRPFAPLDERWVGFDVVGARNPVANGLLLVIGVLGCLFAIAAGARVAEFLW